MNPWIELDGVYYALEHTPKESEIIFCPDCGKVWGRIFSPHFWGWMSRPLTCSTCGDNYFGLRSWDVPGSLVPPHSIGGASDLSQFLSEELWRRELENELNRTEKWLHQQGASECNTNSITSS